MSIDGTGDAGGVSDFAHLHLHSQYSLLDGAIRTKDLCRKVRERGMKSVAVTDHGNMFGTIAFNAEARAHGLKPIFGCETYVAEGVASAKSDRRNFHLVLLAENLTGFYNLQRLVSFGHLRGFYYNPRIDRGLLREHSEGLIGLSACVSGHVSRLVLAGDMDGARATVLEYRDIFKPGRYFLELQPNRLPAQEQVNAALAQLARDCDVPLVATNDCHYVDRSEAHAHDVLMCLGMGRSFDDPNRIRHDCDEFFIKTPDQMWSYFNAFPDAMDNAARIAAMCNVELPLDRPELPEFNLPPEVEEDIPGYLRRLSREGLQRRLGEMRMRSLSPDESAYRARLEHELDTIVAMDFPGYFLIVWDFIRHAKATGVPVGPGRGSGAGSLVAYSLRITDIDPITYDLLFERFLNPERVSMPDFDIDFCMDRREEVIQYVTQRYGADRVGQIATFHTLKARGLIRDVCRVMGVSVAEANDMTKFVPEGPKVMLSTCMSEPSDLKKQAAADPSLAANLSDALSISEGASRLRQRAADSPRVAEIMRIGCALEGLNRHAGTHAAGIVIGNRPLWEHVPCFQADGRIVTQYTMTDVETAGLVKFDFLGLKTLTVLATAVALVNDRREPGQEFVLEDIPMDDASVYELMTRGDTTGVFQLESSGFRDLLKKLRPDGFGDVIAAVALYRPGPLEGGMVDQFIECKHARRSIDYPHPLLEPILLETYGVFVYQEQVMQAAQVLAGFSLGSADLMRRAMGKKKQSEMDLQRQLFVDGCASKHGISSTKAAEIFDLIDKFAGYGFNKSHSAAYGLITYQTAYLKQHHPVAFMAALMTCDKDKTENVVRFIAEARSMNIAVRGPCINESGADFNVVGVGSEAAIRFGLGAVRNVGVTAVESILAARRDSGPFTSLYDFCSRVDLRLVNKRPLESLICAGSFDAVAGTRSRAALFGAIDGAQEQGQRRQRDRNSGQFGLFDALGAEASVGFVEHYPEIEAWSPKEGLSRERDAVGFYLTGHPLDRYQAEIDRHATTRIGDLRKGHSNGDVVLGGVVTEFREVQTKAGRPMAFFWLEDRVGRIEVVIVPKSYAAPRGDLGETLGSFLMGHGDEPLLCKGRLEAELGDEGDVARFKLILNEVESMAQVRRERTRMVRLDVRADQLTDARIMALKHVVANHAGSSTMELRVLVENRFTTEVAFGDAFSVTADDRLLEDLGRLFGDKAASLV